MLNILASKTLQEDERKIKNRQYFQIVRFWKWNVILTVGFIMCSFSRRHLVISRISGLN